MALSLRMPAPPSDEEILALSQRNPGLQFERSATGELLVTPTGGEAGWREPELCAQLRDRAKMDGRGRVFLPGFTLDLESIFS